MRLLVEGGFGWVELLCSLANILCDCRHLVMSVPDIHTRHSIVNLSGGMRKP